ncbi:MAG TPA: ABC transporter ATP-binding protein, partial [Bacilli bacterium]
IIALLFVDYYQLEIPKIFGQIIDGLDEKTLTKLQLVEFMKDMVIIALVMLFGRFLWRICIFGNGIRIETDLRDRMFKHSEKLSQRFYQLNKTGALMTYYTNDLNAIHNAFGNGTVMLVDTVFLGYFAFMRMWKLDHILTLICLIPLLLIALSSYIIGNYMRKKFRQRQDSYADLSDFTQESFSGISVIKAFVKEGKELLAFTKKNQDYRQKNLEFVKASTILNILIGALVGSVNLIILAYGGYLVANGTLIGGNVLTIGQLLEFIQLFGSLTWPMMAIGRLIDLRSQASASLKRVNGLLNQNVEIKDGDDIIQGHQIEGKITFNHLNFHYPDTQKLVLHDITFTINKGESVGIVGRTGSGKTTLVDLLLRLYNLEENQLLLDDVDIMKLPLKDVREAIAYVPQDNFLFSDTIKNNIGFYSKEINEEEIVEAAKNADVDENISAFSLGYDTILGERGVTVSGGQKQRISIARALIKDAQILILDDSVSAVDTKTEEKILHNLRQIRKGKTTILIAHRISTIQSLDKIILIDEGKIVGVGTHDELLQNNALYQSMVLLQKLEDEIEGE